MITLALILIAIVAADTAMEWYIRRLRRQRIERQRQPAAAAAAAAAADNR